MLNVRIKVLRRNGVMMSFEPPPWDWMRKWCGNHSALQGSSGQQCQYDIMNQLEVKGPLRARLLGLSHPSGAQAVLPKPPIHQWIQRFPGNIEVMCLDLILEALKKSSWPCICLRNTVGGEVIHFFFDELKECRGGGFAYPSRLMTVMIIVIMMLKIVMINDYGKKWILPFYWILVEDWIDPHHCIARSCQTFKMGNWCQTYKYGN